MSGSTGIGADAAAAVEPAAPRRAATSPTLMRAGAQVFVGLLCGRVAGFVREVLIAHRFGGGGSADAAAIALGASDAFLNLLAGGALGAALMPEFTGLASNARRTLYARADRAVVAAFAVGALALAFASRWIVAALAPGASPQVAALAAPAMAIGFAVLPLTASSAVATSYIQACGRFGVPAAGTLIYNVVLIAALLAIASLDATAALAALAAASVVGAAIRHLTMVADAHSRPRGDDDAAAAPPLHAAMRRRYAQAVATGAMVVGMAVVARMIASCAGEGSIAVLNYAMKLVELPLATCLSVFAVVLLPKLSRDAADPACSEATAELLRTVLRVVMVLSAAIAAAAAWVARDVASVVYGRGAMTPEAVAEVGRVLTILLVGLPAMGMASVTAAALQARRDTASPFIVASVALAGFAVGGAVANHWFGLTGLAAAWVATQAVVLAGHLVALARRHRVRVAGALVDAVAARGTAAALAVIGMAAAAAPALAPWPAVLVAGIALAVGIAAGASAMGRERIVAALGRAR